MVDIIKASDIREWIKSATGEFHYKDILGLRQAINRDPKLDQKIRSVMYEICHAAEPICESTGKNDGRYRPISQVLPEVDWQNIETGLSFPLELPFNLREYVHIYPNTVTVIAGSKSSGKTGFLMRTIVMNMGLVEKGWNVVFLSTLEGGREQMHDRFYSMHDVKIPTPAPFKTYGPIAENFHDYIKWPNTIYVVDYIKAPDTGEFYLISPAITKIAKKLDNSVAVIGLQKPLGRDTAFGGEATLWDATLYLAIDSGRLKIVDAKVPANGRIHPKNMQWTFQYSESGTKFDNIQPYYGASE